MTGRHPRILCVGLTPALQQTMEFPRLACGEVNRAARTTVTVAGKAANVARVLHTLGAGPILTGFNGGESGRRLLRLLAAEGLRQRFVACPQCTRTCVTIVEGRRVTELVEEASLPGPAYWRELEALAADLLPSMHAVAVSGNLPATAPAGFYSTLAARARRAGTPLVLDSSRRPLLDALAQRPLLAKLNRRELADTFGLPRLRAPELLRKARLLCTRGARFALVTDGPRGGWLVADGAAWQARPPALQAVNPIGSGDAVTAGFLLAWLETRDPAQALRRGMACGAANALTRTPGEVDPARVRALEAEVDVRALSA